MSSTTLYTVGDVAIVTLTCKDQFGALADPDTLVATVTEDLGSTLNYSLAGSTITRVSLGIFTLEVPITVAGKYRGKTTATGAVTPASKNFLLLAVA